MRKVAIIGGEGQLARAIMHVCKGAKSNYTAYGRGDVDICSAEAIERIATESDIIINCAAYTDVERAEEEVERAEEINAHAVGLLGQACQRHDTRLIHISTDYVFGGDSERNRPYEEEETPAPINIYGRSKLHGEEALKELDSAIIIRTSWLYSPWGKNFFRTISSLSATQPQLRVVDDQRGVPTSALSLARFIVGIIESDTLAQMHGIYHYTDSGEATWYEFAASIIELEGVKCEVQPCTSLERKMHAARPHYSVLGHSKIENLCIIPPHWRDSLAEVINIYNDEL